MPRILLVDDESHIRQHYTEGLSDDGYQVTAVGSGNGLLEIIGLLRPHLLVLDIKLRQYNGLELLEEIRRHGHDLPVILCSSYDTWRCDPGAFTADCYVIKSFDLSELKEKIKRSLEEHAVMPSCLTGNVMASGLMRVNRGNS